MKKLTLLAALVVLTATAACGQKLDAANVPPAVKTACAMRYPGIMVKWEKEGGNYEAAFKRNNNSMSALFKPDGTFTESEVDMKWSELPGTVLAYVQQHYTGQIIKGAAKITKADGTINYEAEINKKDLVFDANGKFLKEVKD